MRYETIYNMRYETNWWVPDFQTKPMLNGNIGVHEQKVKQPLAQ